MPKSTRENELSLDPELYARLRERQRARTQHTLLDLASALKIAKRPDYGASFRRMKEKSGLMQPLAVQESATRQYYFGKEFDARQNALNQKIAALKATVQAETTQMGVLAGSAQARARNLMAAQTQKLEDTAKRMDMLQETSPMAQSFVESLEEEGLARPRRRAMTGDQAAGEALQLVAKMEEEWAQVTDPESGLTDIDRERTLSDLETVASRQGTTLGAEGWQKITREGLKQRLLAADLEESRRAEEPSDKPLVDPRSPKIVQMLGNVIRNSPDPGQQGADIIGILNAIGVSAEEAIQQLSEVSGGEALTNSVTEALMANAGAKESVSKELEQGFRELKAVAGRTGPWP